MKTGNYRTIQLLMFSLVALALNMNLVSAQMPPALVVTEQIQMMEFHNQVRLVGRAQAYSKSQMVSSVSGIIREINALEGTPVKFGTPLVTVLDSQLKLKHMAKKAETAQAKARSDLAVADLKRAEKLFAENAISESRMQTVMADATAALEYYNQLSAEEKQLKSDVNNCVIIAPYDGYTVKQLVSVGEWVNPGTPVFEVVDISRIKVVVDLPEKYFGSVATGAEVSIVISNAEKTELIGTVTGIAPNASSETHTFPVFVMVDNSSGKLAGGMLVGATLNLNEEFSALAVTKDAIVRSNSGESIFTVSDGKASLHQVRSVATKGEFVAISGEGLSEGMPVVIRGNERLRPGAEVMVEGEKPKEPAPEKQSDNSEETDSTETE